MVQNLMMMIY